ncbi:response regulator [Spirulina subsalsa FACHB-351]|uniref:histidine kinase n=1 Tax=Spirulina subsalsa FACHB-351 TaxID=234711 RepID=A0ABT3L4T3_9CYAN|nr:ATP-binding protein [Spirulina subsalsa]MCW6036509.1 response regulator [Spirulina subsalsa FACHB-351]
MIDDPLTILVVEDDEIDRMAVRRALKKAEVDFVMVETETCQGALEQLTRTRFDCVFLDYRLPDGNGLDLIRTIRDRQIKIPLIALTGQGDEQIAVELMKAGASDYLSKSKVSPDTLCRSLFSAVRVYSAEQEAQEANQRLLESEERYRLVVEGSHDGIWDWDLQRQTIYGNDRLLAIVGFSPNAVVITPKLILKLLHPDDRPYLLHLVQEHLKGRAEFALEFRIRHQSGEYHYCTVRGKAQRDRTGTPFRLSGVVSDITERKRTEERSRFLASATTLLSATLDYQTTLKNLAHLIVPHLADWCTINLAEPNKSPHLIAVAHVHPEQETLVWQLQGDNRTPQTTQVFQTGQSVACFEVSPALLSELSVSPQQQDLLTQLKFSSYICVPLRTRERILGSILCVWGQSSRHYNQEELEFIEDLAYRAALAIENARLYKEAQEAARMKAQFLAMMSHELRTPMNAIIGFSQVLLRQRSGTLTRRQIQMIESIHNNGKNLLTLINDILDLSKIEAHHLILKPEILNLEQLVATTLDSLRPLADEKQLPLCLESQLQDSKILNDRDRLRQILINLLSNALKFTETGQITITLREIPPHHIQIVVQDSGIGIAPDQQAYIFDEFRQVDQTTTRKYSGTGLGLTITKSLVDLMGGTITVESQLEQGSVFCVTLPRHLASTT